jgi:putative membrane protein
VIQSLLSFVINILILLILSNVIPEFNVESAWVAGSFIFFLTLINWIVVPIFKFLALPFSFLTFGLVGYLINLLAVWFVISVVDGIGIEGGFAVQLVNIIIISVSLSVGPILVHKLLDEDSG